jgi:tetratricopeptide (TPR) repeat protein
MLAKKPEARPTAQSVYETLLPLVSASVSASEPGMDDCRDPTWPFRQPLLTMVRRHRESGSPVRLTEAEADALRANVQGLLDKDQPAEAIRLLEDGVERAGHDSVMELRLRHYLAAALFYAGEYSRAAPLFEKVGSAYRMHLPATDTYVLDSSYHAGSAFAEIGQPDKALPQLRFFVQNADPSADPDEADKILESRFVIAQMLAASGHPGEARAELQAIRPLFSGAYGLHSTHVRNLDKQVDRLTSALEIDSSSSG